MSWFEGIGYTRIVGKSKKKVEFFPDGRILLNDTIEYILKSMFKKPLRYIKEKNKQGLAI